MDKLLNASAINNRGSRTDVPFRGVNIFDEPSQELLYELEASGLYSDLQLAIIPAISRNLASARTRAWRKSFDGFKAILSAANASMSVLHERFNKAVDSVSKLSAQEIRYRTLPIILFLSSFTTTWPQHTLQFTRAIENNEKCWPTEPNLTPLTTLFRESADGMGQCYGKVLHDSRAALYGITTNLSTPLRIPAEIAKQFNYCNAAMNPPSNSFSLLAESTCLAKVSQCNFWDPPY